jgi:hypothetical protein
LMYYLGVVALMPCPTAVGAERSDRSGLAKGFQPCVDAVERFGCAHAQ